jgi:alkanesulfonate monooxygenase SsuD/methylene tetrahydromethanopterin reductase-like flavin-dependent oxidoreductase (luciferase family)
MKQPTNHKRYHMFQPDGTKVIKRFPIDATPPQPWQRGTGPHSPEVYAKIVDHIDKNFKGKPKSDEQRAKMSQAHKGVKKTPEHCANIARAHAKRRKEKRERIQEAYRIAEEIGRDYYAQRLDQRAVDA